MRISDWSSDVCSSDLPDLARPAALCLDRAGHPTSVFEGASMTTTPSADAAPTDMTAMRAAIETGRTTSAALVERAIERAEAVNPQLNFIRSEEHTSELQSLMRITYAVFCLKKKNKNNNTSHNKTNS